MKLPNAFSRRMSGYTLTEALVTIALSAIVLLAMTGLIGSLFSGYRASRSLLTDLEQARVMLGVVTKTLRSTTLMNFDSTAKTAVMTDTNAVYAYDDVAHRCLSFRLQNERLQYGTAPANLVDGFIADLANGVPICDFGAGAIDYRDLTSSKITGVHFALYPSKPANFTANDPGAVGHVTISLRVESDATHTADLQTTVSLRDYEYVGFKN